MSYTIVEYEEKLQTECPIVKTFFIILTQNLYELPTISPRLQTNGKEKAFIQVGRN